MSNLDAVEMVTTSGAIIGQVLILFREANGIKQNDLAAAVKISPSTWSRIEKGEISLSIDQLRAAANALGVTPGVILEKAEEVEHQVKSHGVKVITGIAKVLGGIGSTTGVAACVVLPVFGHTLGMLIKSIGALLHNNREQ